MHYKDHNDNTVHTDELCITENLQSDLLAVKPRFVAVWLKLIISTYLQLN